MQERHAIECPVVGPDRITKIAHAFRAAKTLLSAVELGVFTVLADAPLDHETLGERLGIDKRGARDFFDALVALGLLERDDHDRYANMAETDLYLDRRKPTYIGGELEHFNSRQPSVNLFSLVQNARSFEDLGKRGRARQSEGVR
jgi:hypothetical protein